VGHKVTVLYEIPNDKPLARRIEQKSETFTGSLTAIDAPERTVKAKQLLSSKKFRLARDCRIIADGKSEAELSDLNIGQLLSFSYEEVDGVNVVHRIAA